MTEKVWCDIVLVDDEVLIRQGIKHYLNWEQEGFRIAGEASNGKEALSLIDKLRPHIVLTDIVMPVMDGEELTRQIKSRYPDIEVIILSSFGEFDYVRATFQSGVADYILKPKLEENELLRILKKTAARIPSLARAELASPEKLSMRAAVERLLGSRGADLDEASMEGMFPHRHFCLAGAELRTRPSSSFETGEMRKIMEEMLACLLPDTAACVLEPKSGSVLALLNLESCGSSGVLEWLRAVARLTEEQFPHAAFALSRVYGNIALTADVYDGELAKRLNSRFYLPDRRVIVEEELPAAGLPPGPFPLNRFADEIRHGRYEAAFEELKNYVDAWASCCGTDVFEFKSFLTAIMFNITVLLVNGKHDVKELERVKYAYFNEINESLYAPDAAECLNAFIEEAKLCIGQQEQPGGGNMKRLLEYIEKNYAEPLTLKEMAKHFHFNPSYLSSYFASHNKEGFTEYLNKIRTDKAAEQLRQREATISEISEKVGYSDPSYFSRVFKKATGFSPSEYRRHYAK
ncbi:response regulator transcription factor [Paenibacillus humicus]|uniref:response regulator transcription factor n=1 Tax=Paenibacillus humicus TaxID=412861 RepID=UPI003F1518F1